jgi:hypothetical protein
MLFSKKVIGTVAYMFGTTDPRLFTKSLTEMICFNYECLLGPGEIIEYIDASTSFHSFARNTLVDNTKGNWTLMLDTDHSFEPDILVRMLHLMDKHNLDVLTGIYQFKNYPYAPVLYTKNENGFGFSVIGDWDKDCEVFQISSAGAGCLLVKNTVFDSTFPFSEDHSFFMRLDKLDIKAFCAPSIESYHLATKEVSLKDYDKSTLQMSDRKIVEGRA